MDESKNTKNTSASSAPRPQTGRLNKLLYHVTGSGRIDMGMLAIVLFFVFCGLITVFSASYAYAFSSMQDSAYFFRRQLVFALAGILLMFLISFIPERWIKYASIPAYFAGLGLLGLVLVIGKSQGDAQRWLQIGSITFQPSEFMKFALVAVLAWYYERFYRKVHSKKTSFLFGIVIPLGIIAIPAFLIMSENHLSGLIIILLIGATVMWIGGANRWVVLVVAIIAVFGLGAFITLCKTKPEVVKNLLPKEYMFKRIDMWLNPDAYSVQADTWQTVQGKTAIGSGGLFGRGIGNSLQKHMFVSQPQNDFIYTILCEELGFLGATGVIVAYFIFMIRGIRIARNASGVFSALTVIGIVGHVGIQAMLNIGVVTGALPNTGISLPFFSYGGTALVILLCEMGVVLCISRGARVDP